jgi:hypothetical protein
MPGLLILAGIMPFCCLSQNEPDSLLSSSKRSKTVCLTSTAGYATSSYFLYKNWYSQYELGRFHFHDDTDNWRSMDKLGHIQATYMQTDLLNHAFRWAGDDALYQGAVFALAFQTGIEIMDGFSTAWGFSWADFGSNVAGASLYIVQEKLWNQQRLTLKYSYYPKTYSSQKNLSENGLFEYNLDQRANTLYGTGLLERALKDYNGQTIWLSSNPKDWIKSGKWPDMINVAFGYSTENLFGAKRNSWEINNQQISLDAELYPRSSQFILSLDYRLQGIKTKSRFLKTVFKFMDYIKWPSPAIEYRSTGEWQFHLLFLN